MVTNAISGLEALSKPSTPASVIGSDDVNREDFLKLLIAQLQHQDPLNPVENQEFVAELATFSSLEQQQMQTGLLQQMIDNQNTSDTAQALSLIGKDATVDSDTFFFQEGKQTQFVFNSPGAGNFPVTITNSTGRVVMQDNVAAYGPGQVSYMFDGRNAQGQSIPPGEYSISIGATMDASGEQTRFPTFMRGEVEGVTFLDGAPILVVNGQAVPMSAVQGVYEKQ